MMLEFDFSSLALVRPLPREPPVRPDHARNSVKRTRSQLAYQQAGPVHRTWHVDLSFRDHLETDATVIGFVANKHDETVPFRFRVAERALEHRAANAAATERRLDRQRTEEQRRRVADADRQQSNRADQQSADVGGQGEVQQMINMLAQAVSAEHETTGTEGAFVQTLDSLRVIGGFGQESEGEIGHEEGG